MATGGPTDTSEYEISKQVEEDDPYVLYPIYPEKRPAPLLRPPPQQVEEDDPYVLYPIYPEKRPAPLLRPRPQQVEEDDPYVLLPAPLLRPRPQEDDEYCTYPFDVNVEEDDEYCTYPFDVNVDDDMLTKAYTDAIKDGVEESKTVRLMVIGYGEVGKTSLTRNLMGEPQLKTTSTDGIEVHMCTTSESSSLWSKYEGSPTEFDTDRFARILQQENKFKNTFNSQNNINDKPRQKSRKKLRRVWDSFTRIFQRHKKVKDNNDSTDKPIVVKQGISKSKLRRIRDHVGAQEQRFVKIWDFGGQFVYYATHQLFHSRHAIYLLVLDASMKLDDTVEDNQFPDQTTSKTVKHFCKFWINSIQSYVGTENGDAPPVILVATHTDNVIGGWNTAKQDAFFEDVRLLFDDTILANHIQPKSFAFNNKASSVVEFEQLRKYVMDIADKQQSKNQLSQPARWIQLETAVMVHTDHRHISYDYLCKLDLNNELPIQERNQLLAFLKLHHSLGDLVYFEDDDLSETIIVDPQWIIDAFRSIITSKIFCREHVNLRPKWKALVEEATLSNDLIDSLWSEEGNEDFMKNKQKLIQYMSKLGIISKICEIDIDNREVRDCDFFMIPSLLHTHMPGDVLETILTISTGTTTTLVFVFDNQYVSPTLYHRITAAALGQWKVLVSNGTRLLFDNIGVYELDTVHAGVIELRDTSIEIRVMNICKGVINYTHTDRLRRFVKLVIQREYHRSGVSRDNLFTEHIRCNYKNVTGIKTSPSRELINYAYKSIPCPDKVANHILYVDVIQKEWQLLNATKEDLYDASLAKKTCRERITEREITKLAQAIGKNWQILGLNLGLKEVELERIELDCPNQTLLQIVTMLTKWKKKESERATITTLVRQLKDTRSIGVDWDIINNIIDEQN